MIVANRTTAFGIMRPPFLAPPGKGFPTAAYNNIRLDISSTLLGFGRTRLSLPGQQRQFGHVRSMSGWRVISETPDACGIFHRPETKAPLLHDCVVPEPSPAR
jgi:hypothetical protein